MMTTRNSEDILRTKVSPKIDFRFVAIIIFFSRIAIVDFLSLFGLPKPIMAVVISSVCYIFFILSIIIYRKTIKIDSYLLILICIWFFKDTLTKYPAYYKVYFEGEFDIYQTVFNGFSMMFAYMFIRMNIDKESVFNSFKYIAFINFFGTFWQIINKSGSDYGMRFGYTLSFSAILFLLFYFTEKKVYFLSLSLISISLALIGGSRGTIIGYVCFAFLYIVFIEDKKLTYKKLFSILVLLFFGLLFLLKDFQYFIYNILSLLGFQSRTLLMFIEGNGMNNNGRDAIYYRLTQHIDSLGWFDSLGAYSDRFIMRGRFYSHNFLIESTLSFGKFTTILILLLLIITLIWVFIKYKKTKYLGLLIALGSFSFCRLWISSSFWVEPILGGYLGFLVNLLLQGEKENEEY